MTTYRLERVSAVDLVFEGELLAEVTTDEGSAANIARSRDGEDRWQEVRVYRTDRDFWVVEHMGGSRVPGETARIRATACRSVDDVRRAITFTDRDDRTRRYVTDLSFEAVSLASQADPRLADVLVEHV